MKLSIVLTIYNKEEYLARCLDSCVKQSTCSPNVYEIVAVNDGSTDGSLNILEKYAASHSNIRVLSQQNQGLSMARNNGVDCAQGDYIWFVDADDIISTDAIQIILKAIENNPDVIPICAKTEGTNVIRNAIPQTAKTGKDVILSNKWQHCGPFYIYNKFFLKKFDLRYYPGIYHEDSELTPRILYYAEKVVIINDLLYTVYRDPNSITQVPKLKRAYDNIFVAERLYSFIENVKEEKTAIGSVICHHIAQLFNNGMNIICRFSEDEQSKFNDYIYSKRKVFNALANSSLKYRIENALFRVFPKHYIGVYKFMSFFK